MSKPIDQTHFSEAVPLTPQSAAAGKIASELESLRPGVDIDILAIARSLGKLMAREEKAR